LNRYLFHGRTVFITKDVSTESLRAGAANSTAYGLWQKGDIKPSFGHGPKSLCNLLTPPRRPV
jgi:hypothetical protein